ncbi:prolipoprotein diacylglyceryl transferase [Bdellovibrio sp. qaytius]|nr:prolipoprotein diacylglyceryl transferase [Bdellovibrio sp. qaytius]
MVHDLNPFIFRITETFGPRWYGFAYLLGFLCAYLVIRWLVERQNAELTSEMVSDFVTFAAFGTLIGGRLGYCLFYDQSLLWSFRSSLPFWGVLAVNEGGMASHGGIIGIVVACYLFARKHHLNPVYLLDVVSIVGPIGVFFGRIANFINGELVGRVAPSDFPLGVRFPSDILNWPQYEYDRLPTLAPVVEKLGITPTHWLEVVKDSQASSTAKDELYNTLYTIINKIQNGDHALRDVIGPVLDYRYPSQIFAGLSEGVFTFLVLFFLARKSRRPGVIAGSFIICYSIVRILNEMFREPDIQIGYQALGLTRGQWLSVGMFAFGVFMLFYWSRTQTQTIHGWMRGENVKLGSRK